MEVSYLGAGDDTTRCLIYLLAAPPAPVRTRIDLQEGFKLLSDVHRIYATRCHFV
jgi:hypothetical protein